MARGNAAKRWIFTFNNYELDDFDYLCSVYEKGDLEYLVFGLEIAPTTGTPHLQGFVITKQPQRLTWLRNNLASCHFDVARGNNDEASEYCKKDKPDSDIFEFGSYAGQGQGKRSDLRSFMDSVDAGIREELALMQEHPEVWAKYRGFCMEYLTATRPQPAVPNHPLRPWQIRLNNILIGPVDPRAIIFVVDRRGNSGKTWYAKYHRQTYGNSHYMRMSSEANMAMMMDYEKKVVFFDIPRSKQEHFSYAFIETVKDGIVANSKYHSRMEWFEIPHVVVFMNEPPDVSKLSPDRWSYVEVD